VATRSTIRTAVYYVWSCWSHRCWESMPDESRRFVCRAAAVGRTGCEEASTLAETTG
jgi:hypothetical protein